MEERLSRKLAVLLHADVVGSTALVQANETLAHQRIQNAFRRFSEIISSHGGTAHEIRGDALVAEFPRASDAVSAAVAFQNANSAHNEGLGDDLLPVIRVGIAMGEVVIADDTVTGEGVVLAQRLEQLAESGGVCIQGAAYETVPKRLPFAYEGLGERDLKGFDEPVRVYAVKTTNQPMPQRKSETLELPESPSIAVLPFTNISGDPEQEHFGDGITEDIIMALSRISGLLVVARNSTMVYKGKAVDVKQIGKEQGVRYVLEGSVRKGGDRIRVTAQLIDATTGHHLWADRYDRALDDIFAVQDDITHQIVVEMRVQLSEGEKVRILTGRTKSVEAWERVVRGDELGNRFIREDNLEARRLLEEAVELDPEYPAAWTELGWCHIHDGLMGWTGSLDDTLDAARAAGQKALELDPEFPTAFALLGWVHLLRKEHDRGVESLEKAVMLAPNSSELVANLAYNLVFAGQSEESIEMARRALRLSPIAPMWYLICLGTGYHVQSKHELAIQAFREAIEKEPDSVLAKLWLTSALIESGSLDDARETAREVTRIERNFSLANWQGAQFKDTETKSRIIGNLIKAGLPE